MVKQAQLDSRERKEKEAIKWVLTLSDREDYDRLNHKAP